MLDELERNLLELGLPEEAVTYRISEMRGSFLDARSGAYEPVADDMTCDPKDRHVLAAARHAVRSRGAMAPASSGDIGNRTALADSRFVRSTSSRLSAADIRHPVERPHAIHLTSLVRHSWSLDPGAAGS